MFKFLFAIVFLSELVLASTAIIIIYRFNKQVNSWNNIVISNQKQIKNGFVDFCLFLEDFSSALIKIQEIIKRKRTYYLINFLKTFIAYYSIFTLKGKYKKAIITYQLAKEIYEGFCET